MSSTLSLTDGGTVTFEGVRSPNENNGRAAWNVPGAYAVVDRIFVAPPAGGCGPPSPTAHRILRANRAGGRLPGVPS